MRSEEMSARPGARLEPRALGEVDSASGIAQESNLRQMSHDVERFSRWAPTYERHWMQRVFFEPVQKRVLELAEKEVSTPRTILDVGCGTGRLLRAAAEKFQGAMLEGVDPAEGMVTHARAATPSDRIKFQQATAERLPFPENSFDLVFSTMTFHHWADQRQGTAEVARVLTPKGCWVLADITPSGILGSVLRRLGMKHALARSTVDSTLAAMGLHVVEERRVRSRISVLAIMRTP